MKQKMISFLATCEEDLRNLCKFLYDNPEDSYHEYKSYEYIINLLKKYNFDITKDYLNIPNSFYACKGSGYPKICYLCEYDAVLGKGHLTGHNALTTISVGAALSLGNIIDKIGGSIILIGCPGEYLGGTKSTMAKQNAFEDIDTVMVCHPDVVTCESGTSSSIIPLSIKFIGDSSLSFLNETSYTSLDAILLTFNILNTLLKGFPKNVEVNSILSKGGYTPLLVPLESEAKFYIRASELKMAKLADNKLREIAKYVSNLTHIEHTTSLYEPPNEELTTNRTLNRLFSHNLKENGVINIGPPKNISAGLSIGIVSHAVPCIHPYISIIDDESIKYGTTEFASATISEFAFSQIKKSSLALAFTGADLIENENLLKEIKTEFYDI